MEDITLSERPSTGRTDPSPLTAPSQMADARERHVLSYLGAFKYPVELRTLATGVAAAERNVPVEAVGAYAHRGLMVALHHVHLPVLVAAGLVRYDPESRMAITTGATRPADWSMNANDVRESDPV